MLKPEVFDSEIEFVELSARIVQDLEGYIKELEELRNSSGFSWRGERSIEILEMTKNRLKELHDETLDRCKLAGVLED